MFTLELGRRRLGTGRTGSGEKSGEGSDGLFSEAGLLVGFYLGFQNVVRADSSICSLDTVLFSRFHGIHGPGHSGCQGEGYQRLAVVW